MSNNPVSTRQSVERALKILLSFTPGNREKTVAELRRELELTVSTTSRLLKVLLAYGFLFQDEWTNKYSLGKSAFDVGSAIY
jgi:DNA-binding IclR family transcriptional regulator